MNLLLALGVAFATSQLALFATTIYLHRTVTHSAPALHPVAAFPFRLIISPLSRMRLATVRHPGGVLDRSR